jgi:hypothetical protein
MDIPCFSRIHIDALRLTIVCSVFLRDLSQHELFMWKLIVPPGGSMPFFQKSIVGAGFCKQLDELSNVHSASDPDSV